MVSVQALANTILKKAFEENIRITPMQLQKLLYFVYRDFLREYNIPLFREKFLTWQNGPVLRSAYYIFKPFGANPITRFARDAQNNVFVISGRASDIKNTINTVWGKHKFDSGIYLAELTRRPDTAWFNAYQENEPSLSDEYIKLEPIQY